MAYADANGVHTYYEESGAGEPLLLMHGGFGTADDFEGGLAALSDTYRVLVPERRGHGRTADVEGPYALETLALDTAAFVEEVAGGPVRVAAYSHGAMVALTLAVLRPDLVSRLVLISGVFHHSALLSKPGPEGELPEMVAGPYAALSPDGPDHIRVVLRKVAESMAVEPAMESADLAGVRAPTLVMVGDDDIVPVEHAVAAYRGLPSAELAVVPHASHALLWERPEECTSHVRRFLAGDGPPTFMPVRRGA
ncbi:alpha/beta hydrolase [Nocardiopsis sp. NPDC006198]|uniref:alpha/beta fold hydrolase n=1 Tax=Nocardiopsis sp. NPDC006198 TaxID=3154472 RepID=UPI0033B9DA58